VRVLLFLAVLARLAHADCTHDKKLPVAHQRQRAGDHRHRGVVDIGALQNADYISYWFG